METNVGTGQIRDVRGDGRGYLQVHGQAQGCLQHAAADGGQLPRWIHRWDRMRRGQSSGGRHGQQVERGPER